MIETLVLICILCGYNGRGQDLYWYEAEYYNGKQITLKEGAYDLLAMLFNKCGISFEMFHICITALSLLLIAYVIYKNSNEPAFCISFIYGFSTLEFAWQLKAMISSSIIVWAISILFRNELCKKDIFKFCVLIFVAFEFHFFAIIFLSLLVVPLIKKSQIKGFIFGVTICEYIFMPMIFAILSRHIPDLSVYGVILKPKTIILVSAWQIAGVILVSWSMKGIYSENQTYGDNDFYINNFYYASIVLCLVLPFYLYTVVASRVVRVWFIFYAIFMSYIQGNRYSIQKHCKRLMIIYNIFTFVAFNIIFSNVNLLSEFVENNFWW